MAAHKLILLPADPACPAVSTDRLAMELQAIGLIGASRKLGDDSFYPAGEHFLQLITFLGCSPMIELEPPSDPARLATDSANGTFCHVFLSSSETLRFRSDPRTPAPRCPACRAPLADWQSRLQAWQNHPANSDWHCRAALQENCRFRAKLRRNQGNIPVRGRTGRGSAQHPGRLNPGRLVHPVYKGIIPVPATLRQLCHNRQHHH